MKERVQLSMKECKRIAVLEELQQSKITQELAADRLRLSTRQTRRLIKRYEAEGIKGLIHKNRGKESPHKIPEEFKNKVVDIIGTHYPDFGPVLATEMLEERHNIKTNKETVRQIMIEAGIRTKRTKGRKHRRWREPKHHRGEMVQLDGSFHDWFEGRAPWCWLIRFTDDATGELLYAEFATAESYKAVSSASIAAFELHGLPKSIYTDKGKVFRVNNSNEDDERITQYEYALHCLGIELIHAHSPQAKGRVERNFRTDQDRLVKMLRIHNISSIEKANNYISKKYMPQYNSKFTRLPANPKDFHRPVKEINFSDIFCIREQRKVRNDWTIQYNNRILQITNQRPAIVSPKDIVTVYERLNNSIFIKKGESMLKHLEVQNRPTVPREPKPIKYWKLGRTSPWRRSNSMFYGKRGHFHKAKQPDIITLS